MALILALLRFFTLAADAEDAGFDAELELLPLLSLLLVLLSWSAEPLPFFFTPTDFNSARIFSPSTPSLADIGGCERRAKFRIGSGGGGAVGCCACFDERFLSAKPERNSTVVSEANLLLTDANSADDNGDCSRSELPLVFGDMRLELAASFSADFFFPPKLSDDNDRGNRDRNAGVSDELVGFGVGGVNNGDVFGLNGSIDAS